MPNITGTVLKGVRDVTQYSGAFYSANDLASEGAEYHRNKGGFGFDASRVSGVYKNGKTTVLTMGVEMHYCIKY